jgi:hypothetical protein
MNITEAQAVSTLVNALHGQVPDTHRLVRDVQFLTERIHRALYASPTVDALTVEKNAQLLEQEGWQV